MDWKDPGRMGDPARGKRCHGCHVSYMNVIVFCIVVKNSYKKSTQILQVLRSAPLMMMMMDVEDQFKTKWKRRWRKAISGDPDKRIRDHMDDKEVQKRIRLVDTASFTLGKQHQQHPGQKLHYLCEFTFCLLKWDLQFCNLNVLFCKGVFMAMWVEYLILAAPSAFPWFYLVRQNSFYYP